MSYLFCIDISYYQYDPVSLAPLAEPNNAVAMGNLLLGGVTNGLFPVGNIYYDAFISRFGKAGGGGAVFFSFLIFMARDSQPRHA